MGCDIFWNAQQPEIQKQRQCSLFLQAFFELQKLESDVYNQNTEGYFLNLDSSKELPSQRINFLGVTAYPYTREILKIINFPAQHQLSFVFDNTPNINSERINRLITIERISDFNCDKYLESKQKFTSISSLDGKLLYGLYKTGGYDRCVDGAFNTLVLFYLVKTLFLPLLSVSDDYLNWESVTRWADEKGYHRALLSSSERWAAIEAMTSYAFKNKFQEQHITQGLKSFWDVDVFTD
jgi:hypothetical protein